MTKLQPIENVPALPLERFGQPQNQYDTLNISTYKAKVSKQSKESLKKLALNHGKNKEFLQLSFTKKNEKTINPLTNTKNEINLDSSRSRRSEMGFGLQQAIISKYQTKQNKLPKDEAHAGNEKLSLQNRN